MANAIAGMGVARAPGHPGRGHRGLGQDAHPVHTVDTVTDRQLNCEDERSAWAWIERERQERERPEREEEEDWLEYQRQAAGAQDFWGSQRGQW